ncbi:MAG: right-handed parallel beta-helix repeat-containing protein [Holophaga sp.]|nr:right-handed parallel beta-helix repeat-containing protein [Holophaga sp.]
MISTAQAFASRCLPWLRPIGLACLVIATLACGGDKAAAPPVPPVVADTQAPSVPTGLTASAVTATGLTLSWTASTDNVAVAGYRVYRNAAVTPIATVPSGVTFADTGLTASTAYTYAVDAIDAAGNASAKTSVVNVTTANTVPTTPVISAFTASPTTITAGGSSTLAWTVTGAASLSLNGETVTGTSKVVTPTVTTTYTLTTTNALGSATRQATVTVNPAGFGTTYHIDFETGSDTNSGLTTALPWKHAPGDAAATANPRAVVLGPGDVVQFKGGVVYRGQIDIRVSGAAGSPITFRGEGWGSGKAIIDGSEPMAGTWQRCANAAEAGGNPDWNSIFYLDYVGTLSPFGQFFDQGERIYLAQGPNLSNPFWDDRYREYWPVTPANITLTSITDPVVLNQSSAQAWTGAHVQIWVNPNVITIRPVTGFDPTTSTIRFDTLESIALYGDRNQYFSLVNHLRLLDRAGEYVVDEVNHRLYYWPVHAGQAPQLSVSTRAFGINTHGRSHLVLEGFILQNNTSDTSANAITDDFIATRGSGLVVRNNEIRWVRTKNGRKGSIQLNYTNAVTIENNWIHHCQRNSGLLIGTNDILIQDNTIETVGYKGLWFMGVNRARILRNLIRECSGTHGNPASVFTSSDVLIAHNRLYGGAEVLTFEQDGNLVIHNNLIHSLLKNGVEVGSSVLRENGDGGTGYHVITNNTILNSENNHAIGISNHTADPLKLIIHNNIADGADIYLQNVISHNLYTGLSWRQQERQGWRLSAGEKIETDLSKIFVNAVVLDLNLLSTSPARNAGINLTTQLPAEVRALFHDFDWAMDLVGNTRGTGTTWDMGAYAFKP